MFYCDLNPDHNTILQVVHKQFMTMYMSTI